MGLSKLYSRCQQCPYQNTCENKKMEGLAYAEPFVQGAAAPLTEDAAAPILRKHDYRNIKVAEGTTITIDLEELKEKMRQDFYSGLLMGAT